MNHHTDPTLAAFSAIYDGQPTTSSGCDALSPTEQTGPIINDGTSAERQQAWQEKYGQPQSSATHPESIAGVHSIGATDVTATARLRSMLFPPPEIEPSIGHAYSSHNTLPMIGDYPDPTVDPDAEAPRQEFVHVPPAAQRLLKRLGEAAILAIRKLGQRL